jgi:hypothetical protein
VLDELIDNDGHCAFLYGAPDQRGFTSRAIRILLCPSNRPLLGLGKPWLWITAPQTGHSIYAPAEDFIRDYFAAILANNGSASSGTWVDINLKANTDKDTVTNQASATGWLPNANLLSEWQTIHHP